MFCTQCGHQIPDDHTFCTACGSSVPDLPGEEPAPADPTPVPEPAEWPGRPAGETVLFEDDGILADESADACIPIPTILDEPEPISASLRLEVDDAETGIRVADFRLQEGQLFVIGRDVRASDFIPADPRSSRRHFSLVIGPEGFILEDLGSSNGTFVNGVRVTEPIVIQDGDTIEYGRSKAVVRVVEEPAPWPRTTHGLMQM